MVPAGTGPSTALVPLEVDVAPVRRKESVCWALLVVGPVVAACALLGIVAWFCYDSRFISAPAPQADALAYMVPGGVPGRPLPATAPRAPAAAPMAVPRMALPTSLPFLAMPSVAAPAGTPSDDVAVVPPMVPSTTSDQTQPRAAPLDHAPAAKSSPAAHTTSLLSLLGQIGGGFAVGSLAYAISKKQRTRAAVMLGAPVPTRARSGRVTASLAPPEAASETPAQILSEMLGADDEEGVINKFEPGSSQLWFRWRGTVLTTTWKVALINMLVCTLFTVCVRIWLGTHHELVSWKIFTAPDISNPLIARLKPFEDVWEYGLTLATFTLTFFLSNAQDFWRSVYDKARNLQGSLEKVAMLLSTSTTQDNKSKETMKTAVRYLRASYILYWATIVKRYESLNTPSGLQALRAMGLLLPAEVDMLSASPSVDYHETITAWLLDLGLAKVASDNPTKGHFLGAMAGVQDAFGSIGDALAARTPMVHMHLVQMLVDSMLFAAPFALYEKLGMLAIFLAPTLVVFYRGLLDVAKSFYDPFGNRGTRAFDRFRIPVLVRDLYRGVGKWLTAKNIEDVEVTPGLA